MKNPLQRILAAGNRISVRLYLGIGGAVALTMITSLIAWLSFTRVGDSQTRVDQYVPGMVGAFLLAQQGNALTAAAPRLTAALTREDFARVREEVFGERALFEDRLNELIRREESDGDAGAHEISVWAEALVVNIQAIEDSVAESFTLNERRENLQIELAALQRLLERQLVEAIDDQFFYAVTGYRQLDRPPAEPQDHFTEVEFHRFRYLMGLELAGNLGSQILASVSSISDPRQLEPLRERFEAAAAKVNRNLGGLGDSAMLSPELQGGFDRLVRMGAGEGGSFEVQARMLALAERQRQLLTINRELAASLGTEIEKMVSGARARSLGATLEATETIGTARKLLLWVNLLAVAGAIGIGWSYVGRLVSRIKWLSDRMRGMAAGDLEANIEVSGRDEVAEMASALEVFRRSSLEAQRLNLVEKLAEELREKNDELENVLEELRQVQDQVVMREKLAALGELTAGVAHEIKNPLNFVKNFAEGSIEILEELKGVISENDTGELTEDQRQLMLEIGSDLDENLSSILRNGERANRIVQDMLGMGRGSGEFQVVDLNSLVMEHANLAYHAARAADSNFQITIKDDLDPEVGEVNVIPHDIARVFLNMVSNACYATDEKRKRLREEAEASEAGERYEPLLEVSTRRGEDDVTVTIRDNGSGIPKDLVDKVFNPFFTTKPPDKGTGLGLSLSNDIVVKHGGEIKVSTEAGEYTEMSVRLPAKPGAIPRPEPDSEEDLPPPSPESAEGAEASQG